MTWETFQSRYTNNNYVCEIDFDKALMLMKKHPKLIDSRTGNFKFTRISYLGIIYLLRALSLIALSVSIYYEVGDWWFGLFGWFISDYLFFELGKLSAETIILQTAQDESLYTFIKNFEQKHKLTVISVYKKNSVRASPLYKKIMKIFLH